VLISSRLNLDFSAGLSTLLSEDVIEGAIIVPEVLKLGCGGGGGREIVPKLLLDLDDDVVVLVVDELLELVLAEEVISIVVAFVDISIFYSCFALEIYNV
jgi:hypothetical protein